jgi:hypothetical protein
MLIEQIYHQQTKAKDNLRIIPMQAIIRKKTTCFAPNSSSSNSVSCVKVSEAQYPHLGKEGSRTGIILAGSLWRKTAFP